MLPCHIPLPSYLRHWLTSKMGNPHRRLCARELGVGRAMLYRHVSPPGELRIAGKPGKLDSEKQDYAMKETRFCSSASCAACGAAGNCNTVACWSSSSVVSNTISPLGNSSAS